MSSNLPEKLRKGWRNAFSLKSPHGPLTERDFTLLDKLAHAVADRGMAVPAKLFLGSVRPLNAIGSQSLVFLRPFLVPLLNTADYDRMTEILDRREGIAALIDAIEVAEGALKKQDKRRL